MDEKKERSRCFGFESYVAPDTVRREYPDELKKLRLPPNESFRLCFQFSHLAPDLLTALRLVGVDEQAKLFEVQFDTGPTGMDGDGLLEEIDNAINFDLLDALGEAGGNAFTRLIAGGLFMSAVRVNYPAREVQVCAHISTEDEGSDAGLAIFTSEIY